MSRASSCPFNPTSPMPSVRRKLALALLFAELACRSSAHPALTAPALLERDRAWARAAEAGNVDSILDYWTDDARVLLPDQPALVGKPALRAMVSGSLAVAGFHITWKPDSAVVSASGDLAYTYGSNQVTAPDATGHLATTEGRYVTVWRAEPDGRWRCAVDIYNLGPAVTAAGPQAPLAPGQNKP